MSARVAIEGSHVCGSLPMGIREGTFSPQTTDEVISAQMLVVASNGAGCSLFSSSDDSEQPTPKSPNIPAAMVTEMSRVHFGMRIILKMIS